jgi:hypothetical protein
MKAERNHANLLFLFISMLLGTLLAPVAATAQQIYGVPGSPSATRSIEGKQLPPPPMKFGGKIERNAAQSKPCGRRASYRPRVHRTSC